MGSKTVNLTVSISVIVGFVTVYVGLLLGCIFVETMMVIRLVQLKRRKQGEALSKLSKDEQGKNDLPSNQREQKQGSLEECEKSDGRDTDNGSGKECELHRSKERDKDGLEEFEVHSEILGEKKASLEENKVIGKSISLRELKFSPKENAMVNSEGQIVSPVPNAFLTALQRMKQEELQDKKNSFLPTQLQHFFNKASDEEVGKRFSMIKLGLQKSREGTIFFATWFWFTLALCISFIRWTEESDLLFPTEIGLLSSMVATWLIYGVGSLFRSPRKAKDGPKGSPKDVLATAGSYWDISDDVDLVDLCRKGTSIICFVFILLVYFAACQLYIGFRMLRFGIYPIFYSILFLKVGAINLIQTELMINRKYSICAFVNGLTAVLCLIYCLVVFSMSVLFNLFSIGVMISLILTSIGLVSLSISLSVPDYIFSWFIHVRFIVFYLLIVIVTVTSMVLFIVWGLDLETKSFLKLVYTMLFVVLQHFILDLPMIVILKLLLMVVMRKREPAPVDLTAKQHLFTRKFAGMIQALRETSQIATGSKNHTSDSFTESSDKNSESEVDYNITSVDLTELDSEDFLISDSTLCDEQDIPKKFSIGSTGSEGIDTESLCESILTIE